MPSKILSFVFESFQILFLNTTPVCDTLWFRSVAPREEGPYIGRWSLFPFRFVVMMSRTELDDDVDDVTT